MSVWLAIPSKREPEEVEPVLKAWRERGYKIALHRDVGESIDADIVRSARQYPGYAVAVNTACRVILELDPQASWIVCAGDDTYPDPNHSAEEVALQCRAHFYDSRPASRELRLATDTFGVMQPTGDPWSDSAGRIIERIAGSPWIGREFARRMYGGAGPYWHEYRHCFVDEELQCVAQKLGVFWQRPDLIHHHQNWARPKHPQFPAGDAKDMPAFLAEANSAEHWAKYSNMFKERKEQGFPGHEPIL